MSAVKVSGIGVICSDPKEVEFKTGSRATFRFVQNIWTKDAKEPSPTFWSIIASKELTPTVLKLKKGSKLKIKGELGNVSTYTGKDGTTYVDATIFMNSFEFANGRKTIAAVVEASEKSKDTFIDDDSHRMDIFGVGNLTQDAEIKGKSGNTFTAFSLAFNRSKDQTTFADCLYSNEKICEYMTKGKKLFVTGTLRPFDVYDKKDGTKGVAIRIFAETVDFVGGSNSESSDAAKTTKTEKDSVIGNSSTDPMGAYFEMAGDDDLPF